MQRGGFAENPGSRVGSVWIGRVDCCGGKELAAVVFKARLYGAAKFKVAGSVETGLDAVWVTPTCP